MNGRPDSWRELYPFASHYFTLPEGDKTGNACRMHYVDEAPAIAGSSTRASRSAGCLLMVHGNPTWSFYWRNLILRFRQQMRCVAPDHLGMGFSDKPSEYKYCLEQHIENLCALVQHLQLKSISLAVHDWGGAIGLGMAIRMPELIDRLIITNTAAFPPPFIPWRIRVCRWPILGPWLMNTMNVFPRTAVRMATTQTGGLDADVAAGLMAPYKDPKDRSGVFHFVNDIPSSPAHPTWKVLNEIESNLPVLSGKPVQLIWGMRDWCFRPTLIDRMIAPFENVNVCRIQHAGHYVAEDAAEELIDQVDEFIPVGLTPQSAGNAPSPDKIG